MAMLDSDYPTEQQMREVYEAYQSGKPGAIAEVLRKRQQEREGGEAENAKDTQKVEQRNPIHSGTDCCS